MLNTTHLLVLCFFLAVSTVMAAMQDTTLYFAYGSNMLKSRLEERVGPVAFVGVATLAGYAVNFSKAGKDNSGKFNIEEDSPSGIVYGALFKIPTGKISVLDRFEGTHYTNTDVKVHMLGSGKQESAITYIGKTQFLVSRRYMRPSQEYANFVLDGAKEAGLPVEYVAHLNKAVSQFVGPFIPQSSPSTAQQTNAAQQNAPTPFYFFSYGVNMTLRKVQEKINGVSPMGVATLSGWKFNFHKKSMDGSGKCNMSVSPQGRVKGFLYKIPADQKSALNTFNFAPTEYESVNVQVQVGGQTYPAVAYVARQNRLDISMKPEAGYKRQVLGVVRTLGDDAYCTEISNL